MSTQPSAQPNAPAPDHAAGGGHGDARVVIWAFFVNLLIAVIKFIVAAVSGSTAMLAEALHSLADCGNQVFLLVGMRLSARPPDEEHPFGYATERYFWAFMAALGIFLVGGSVSAYEGIKKVFFEHEDHLGDTKWAFVVLGVSIVLEGISFFVAVREFRKEASEKGVRRTVKEARDTTLITVLFEDTAAMVGLVVAFLGLLLAELTHDPRWDGAASILVGVVLITVAWFLARASKALIIGRSVPESERRRIAEIAAAARDVRAVIHIRTVHLGPDEVMCGLKLSFTPTLDTRTLELRINELEAQLRAELPHLRRIYVEPGFDEHPHAGPTHGAR